MDPIWGERDGLTTIELAPGAVPGPLRSGLVFGVGRIDESLATAGVCHLVEHLVLHAVPRSTVSYNGMVDTVTTSFVASGGPEQLVEFYSAVAHNLRELPIERLAQEVRILAIEDERNGATQLGVDLAARFGPCGPGLLGWSEHGLTHLTADDLREWVCKWFTLENAALWASGRIPAALDLSVLPHGEPPGPAPPRPMHPPPKSYVPHDSTPFASVSLVADRDRQGGASMLGIAYERVFDRLRGRDGIVYGVVPQRVPLDATRALWSIQTDGDSDRWPEVVTGLIGVIEELATDGPTPEELERVRAISRSGLEDVDVVADCLHQNACRHRFGLPPFGTETVADELESVDLGSLRDDLSGALSTLLVVGPRSVTELPSGWTVYDGWSSHQVIGTRYDALDGREDGTLVVGEDGVTYVRPDDLAKTVGWDEAVAYLVWDDGQRVVIGPTGAWVAVSPWCWRSGHRLPQVVDDALGPERRIRIGDGSTQYLQQPGDPTTATDVRWLGTVGGARHRGAPVHLVVDTDGVFVLWSDQTEGFMRSMSRTEMLRLDDRNRWIPVDDVESVELLGPGFLKTKPRLRIYCRPASLTAGWLDFEGLRSLEIQLASTRQVELIRYAFGQLMGHRYYE